MGGGEYKYSSKARKKMPFYAEMAGEMVKFGLVLASFNTFEIILRKNGGRARNHFWGKCPDSLLVYIAIMLPYWSSPWLKRRCRSPEHLGLPISPLW